MSESLLHTALNEIGSADLFTPERRASFTAMWEKMLDFVFPASVTNSIQPVANPRRSRGGFYKPLSPAVEAHILEAETFIMGLIYELGTNNKYAKQEFVNASRAIEPRNADDAPAGPFADMSEATANNYVKHALSRLKKPPREYLVSPGLGLYKMSVRGRQAMEAQVRTNGHREAVPA